MGWADLGCAVLSCCGQNWGLLSPLSIAVSSPPSSRAVERFEEVILLGGGGGGMFHHRVAGRGVVGCVCECVRVRVCACARVFLCVI